MSKIKELANPYIPDMTGLRNLSKQEKTKYTIDFKWKRKRDLFRIQSDI